MQDANHDHPDYLNYAPLPPARPPYGRWALVTALTGLGLVVAPFVLLRPPRRDPLEFGLPCAGLVVEIIAACLAAGSLARSSRASRSDLRCAIVSLVLSLPLSLLLALFYVMLVFVGIE